jgi:hypothetical protein
MQPIFETEPLSLMQLGVTFLASVVLFFAVEAEKILLRAEDRKAKNQS